MIQQGAAKERAEFDYHRFCNYAASEILGAEVQAEYLYIVQPNKISVYEYHGNCDQPQLSEQLIHNTIILNYCINQHYICIHSPSLIQVRDRRHWQNVFYTQPLSKGQKKKILLILQEHELYIADLDDHHIKFDRISLKDKSLVDTIDLGTADQNFIKSAFRIKPIFIQKMGMLNDFYICIKAQNKIELGMLYISNSNSKKAFQINKIQLSDSKIHNIYHHKVLCHKYPNQSSEYVLIIAQKHKELYLNIFQILPKQQKHSVSQDALSNFEDILNQFTFLGKFNQISSTKNNSAEEHSKQKLPDSPFISRQAIIEIKLQNSGSYQSSFLCQNKLWVLSTDKICKIELINESTIQSILQNRQKLQKIINRLQYQRKQSSKIGVAIYKQKILFKQSTVSFILAFQRQSSSQSIAEQIAEFEDNTENAHNQDTQNHHHQINQIVAAQPIASKDEDSNQKDPVQQQSQNANEDLLVNDPPLQIHKSINTETQIIHEMADYGFQTLIDQGSYIEIGIQTQQVVKSAPPPSIIGYDEIQDLVVKYSSTLNVTCTKIKQNQFQKDKFDKQIFNIVDTMAKTIIQPFLEQRYISILNNKVKQLSLSISSILHQQIQILNQNMRKIELKEGNLRGKKIFQFSNQIEYIKQTVTNVFDALKSNQINKFAFNQVILQQAKNLNIKVNNIQKSINQIVSKNEKSEQEINERVLQIVELVKILGKQRQISEESESELEESEDESEDQELEEAEDGQRSSSQKDNQPFQEDLPHQSSMNNHKSQTHPYAQKGYQSKAARPFEYIDSQGYYPIQEYPQQKLYPQPPPFNYQMPPYFYPFPPSQHSPYQPYYPPVNHFNTPYPQKISDPPKANAQRKIKSKKSSKPSN